MIIELTKFRVKDGKSEMVDEWLNFLNNHIDRVMLTLEDEQMYVESIFRLKEDNNDYLYWYSIQGEDGKRVEDSDHWVDQKHLEYWEECIDETFMPIDLNPEVSIFSKKISEHIM